MPHPGKFILILLFVCALLTPQTIVAEEYAIGPPPPPQGVDLALGQTSAITGQIRNLTDQSSTTEVANLTALRIAGPSLQEQTGRAVDSTDLTFFFEYDRQALLVQQSLNTADNFFFDLRPGEISPNVGFFDITVLRLGSAQIGETYPVFAFVRDRMGGQSNTVRIDVTATAVPEPTTMLLLSTGLAGVAAAIRKRRKHQPEI